MVMEAVRCHDGIDRNTLNGDIIVNSWFCKWPHILWLLLVMVMMAGIKITAHSLDNNRQWLGVG